MSRFGTITIRPVESSDLEIFYAHQLDQDAIRIAAFAPRNKAAFEAHWEKILRLSQNVTQTVVADGQVAGYVACFPRGENLEVAYWLGREFWGKGLATQALKQLLHLVKNRPIFARTVADNVGSIRVLQKCGFSMLENEPDFANGRGEPVKEYIFRLDAGPAPE